MMYAFAFLKIEHVEDEFLKVVSKPWPISRHRVELGEHLGSSDQKIIICCKKNLRSLEYKNIVAVTSYFIPSEIHTYELHNCTNLILIMVKLR